MTDQIRARIIMLRRFAAELNPESAETYIDELDSISNIFESYAISHPEKTDYEIPRHGDKLPQDPPTL